MRLCVGIFAGCLGFSCVPRLITDPLSQVCPEPDLTGLTYSTPNAAYIPNLSITQNSATLATGKAASCSISPSLPSGLSLSSSCGISGTPTGANGALATYTVTANGFCGASSTTGSLQLRVLGSTDLWTWVSGASTVNQSGTYGTKGTAASANIPGARNGSVSWIDSTGNLWLFGGMGYDSAGSNGRLNDLWKWDGSNWTWVSGANTVNQSGTYGTKGTSAPANIPGARRLSISWIDSTGNLWLFGGFGLDSAGSASRLNDLWKWDGSNWTWVSGANTINQSGTYGTKGTAAPANIPGARNNLVSWIDSTGNLWLFGGFGLDSAGSGGNLNDLWKWDGSNWTWVSGANTINQSGTYGTKGTAAPANVPGARVLFVSWIDSTGNLWLFGGFGLDSAGSSGYLNDLWKWDGSNWTWMSGANTINQSGTYGTKGTAAPANVPGARRNTISWIDSTGNFWLFGGFGYDSAGSNGRLNDLWKWDGSNWTWVSGANTVNQSGTYGTKGTAATANIPGARNGSVSWIDSTGNLWLFGGDGYDSAGSTGDLNDLWKYSY
jgi:N-acetylneuraminic acid mutarotase